jgi:uncharacterized protein (DUF1501 family)
MVRKSSINRRRFLAGSVRLTLGSAGVYAALGSMSLMNALAASSAGAYRALVCVFLRGGNDSFNMLVPRSDEAYRIYADARRNLALAQEDILPVTTRASDGVEYGFHLAMPGVQQLFESGRLAVLSNVGALLEPVTKTEVMSSRANLPPQLFSHNDQRAFWLRLGESSGSTTGWAGRMADLLLESDDPLAMNVSLAGSNIWQTGAAALPYSISPDGAVTLLGIDPESTVPGTPGRTEAFLALLSSPGLFQSEFGRIQRRAMDTAATVDAALQDQTPLTTDFPDDWLGRSLRMTARMIQARGELGVSRQVFFIVAPGWDTHSDQLTAHPTLLSGLSAGLSAFYQATEELGMADKVTTFTASDFGRTLTSNGDGTDHGWGGNQLIMGGSVNGGKICGAYPSLELGSDMDVGGGRLIPTTSVDQYGAELARWFASFSSGELSEIFPNLARFGRTPLGLIA